MESHVKTIAGNWDAGYVLDKHTRSSTFIGNDEFGHPQFDTKRSEVGEALYQLKYKGDFTKVEALANEITTHIVPRLGPIGLIIPMPATNERPRQPVTEIARALGERIKVPVFENILVKSAAPAGAIQLKDITEKGAKIAALSGRFAINPAICNDGKWNALIVDDLFDSGASMEAAVSKLREYQKIDQIFATALTWK